MKKRFLALILVFALSTVFSACPVPAQEMPDMAVENTDTYSDSIETLSSLGILDWDVESFSMSDSVTRGDFTRLVTNIVSNGVYSADLAVQVFADVTANSQLGAVLYSAMGFGIVNGDGSGNFYPDRPITAGEAYKIIACALGFGDTALSQGGYPGGYVMSCVNAGLDAADIYGVSETLTPDMAADIIVGALECNTMKIGVLEGNVVNKIDYDTTWLYETKKIYVDYGIMTANSITSLSEYPLASKDYVCIDNVIYNTDKNYDKYLGYRVKFYYKAEKGTSDNYLYHMVKYRNEEFTLDSSNLEDDNFVNGTLKYYLSDTKTDDVEIPTSAYVIFNNRAITTYGDDLFNIDYGRVTFIDYDLDSEIDVVKIIEYKNIVVGAVNADEKTVADKYSAETLNLEAEGNHKKICIYDETGKSVGFDKISTGNVLTYIESEDGMIITAYISKKTVTGTIEAKGENFGKSYCGIRGQEIFVAPDINFDLNRVSVGKEGTVYLNAFGEISDFVTASDTDNLMCLIKPVIDKLEGENALVLKVITVNGEIKHLIASEKIKVNNVSVKASITNGTVPEALKGGELVLIELDAEGLVRKVETANAEGSKLHTFGDNEKLSYWAGQRTFGGKWFANADAKVFVVPDDETVTDNDYYRVSTITSEFVSDVGYFVTGYTIGDGQYFAKAILVKKAPRKLVITGNEFLVVKSIRQSVDKDNNVVNTIEVGGYTVDVREYNTKDETILADAQVGDIILCNINNGTIVDGEVVMYGKDFTYNPSSVSVSEKPTTYMAGTNYKSGNVLYRNGDILVLVDDEKLASAAGKSILDYRYSDFEYTNIANAKFFVVDSQARDKSSMVYRADKTAINDYLSYGKASKLFICTRTGIPRLVVIYK